MAETGFLVYIIENDRDCANPMTMTFATLFKTTNGSTCASVT